MLEVVLAAGTALTLWLAFGKMPEFKKLPKLKALPPPNNLLNEKMEFVKTIFREGGMPEHKIPQALKRLQLRALLSAVAGSLLCFWGLELSPPLSAGCGLVLGLTNLMSINSRTRRRKELLSAEFPYSLDLVSLSMKAGMSFLHSLTATQQALPEGPLREELTALNSQLRHGASLEDALESLAPRMGLKEFQAFTQAVVAAQSLGSDLAGTIHAQADLQRNLSFTRQEKKAQTAPVRMMFPLFVFIFPTIFAMILTPLYLVFRASGGF